MLSQDTILNALKTVKYPGFSRDIVSFGLIKDVSAAGGAVSVALQLTSPNPDAARQIKAEAEQVLKQLPGVSHVVVEVRQPTAARRQPAALLPARPKSRASSGSSPWPAAKVAWASPPAPRTWPAR